MALEGWECQKTFLHVESFRNHSCEFYNTEVDCILFWLIFLPLQVAPGFACSVASLNQSPGHQLPGCHSLRCGTLADYPLGQGKPSINTVCRTCAAPPQSTAKLCKATRVLMPPAPLKPIRHCPTLARQPAKWI